MITNLPLSQVIAKSARAALGGLVLAASAGVSHAQIIWALPQSITGASDVSTLGKLFDAMEADSSDISSQTVNGVTFNRDNNGASDGKISLSFSLASGGTSGAGTGGGASTPSTSYNALLTGNEYVRGTGSLGIITIGKAGNLLTPGDTYEVEIWDAAYSAIFSGGTGGVGSSTPTVTLTDKYVIGTFVAGSTGIESFTWTPPSSTYSSLSAIEVREIPEPPVWAMLLGGATVLVFARRLHRLAA